MGTKRIVTLGDSIMQFNNFLKFPQTGWPQALVRFVNPDIEILNLAVNGKSTKDYIDKGLFDRALTMIEEEDLVLIGFGHNDAHPDDMTRHTKPYGDYQANLKKMVDSVKAKGADVILLTSVASLSFEDENYIDPIYYEYTLAVKELAHKLKVDYIDLYELTKQVIVQKGFEASKRYFMYFEPHIYESYEQGLKDIVHLRYEGAFMVCRCFYQEMLKKGLFNDLFIKV